jgi:hypothetical protein
MASTKRGVLGGLADTDVAKSWESITGRQPEAK